MKKHSQQSCPEAQPGVSASGRAGWRSTAVSQQGRLCPQSGPAPSSSPAHSDMRMCHCSIVWHTEHCGNSTQGYEQWTNAISPQSISLLEFVCTWNKLNWIMLWCCLSCWENRKAWSTWITLFIAQYLETLKNGYTLACSNSSKYVFWSETCLRFLTDHTGALPLNNLNTYL